MAQNLTALFLGDEASWGEAQVVLGSVQGLWGGHHIAVSGDGGATVRLVGRGALDERAFQLALPLEEARGLLSLLVAHDLLAIEPPPRQWLVPDETVTTITLQKGGRRSFSLAIWANDPPHPGAKAILDALLGLIARTAGLEPVYKGQYRG